MSRAREVSKASINLNTLESNVNTIENNVNSLESDLVTLETNIDLNFEKDIAYSSASPISASVGQIWIDSTDNNAPLVKVYNGTTWVEVSGAGGGDPVPQSLLLGGI